MKSISPLIFIVFFAIILSGCTSSISMRAVDLDSFFTDNSSKVWLVNKLSLDGNDISPLTNGTKDVFIFYDSGRIAIQPLNSLGKQPIMSGNFYIDPDNKTMKLVLNQATWKFNLDKITLEKVVLSPQESSTFQYGIDLIPLPEF